MRNLLIILLLFLSISSFSQQRWVWSIPINGTNNIESESIYTDSENSIYVLVEFYGTINILGNNFTSFGNKDIALIKLSENGEFIWCNQIGDANIDDPKCLVIHNDNIFITGSFELNSIFQSKEPIDCDCMNRLNSGTYIIIATSMNEIYKKKLIIR